MIKILIITLCIIVSILSLTAAPTWTRDFQVDSGQVKAVNFQTFIGGKLTAIIGPNNVSSAVQPYNNSNFSSIPRVILAMKSYGVIPYSAFTNLTIGYRFFLSNFTVKNFTYTLNVIGVSIVSLHYQYFAVAGYNNLFNMQFYTIVLNTTNKVYDTTQPSPRTDSITLANPNGFITDTNYTSSQLILKVWAYSYIYIPTTSAFQLGVVAIPSSSSTFTLTISTDHGCSIQQIRISVLYLNKTQIYLNAYSAYFDLTTYNITGSDSGNALVSSTMTNTSLQYQFRNSQEGIADVYLPFSNATVPTYYYFTSTSANTSKMYYVALQQKLRVCSGSTPYFLVDDQLCHDKCPSPYYGLNTTYGYCKKCHYSCLNCTFPDSSSTCTLCNSTAIRNLSNNSCNCNLTYFDNGTEQCIPCEYTCLTCSSTTAISCLSCDSALHRSITNSTCPCSYGYYQNTTCFSCLNRCIECSYTQLNQTYQCKACNSSLFMAVGSSTQTCICQNGYFENITCFLCLNGCIDCQFNQINQTYQCKSCNLTLFQQIDSSQQSCICSKGYYKNNDTCLTCITGCLNCSTALTCNECNTSANWIINLTDNTCKCITNFYLHNNICQPCSTGCTTCFLNNSILICSICDNTTHFQLSNISCICEDGYSLNGSTCNTNTSILLCSNGIVNIGQACDDGNNDNFDGCSSTCLIQTNHICINNIISSSICYYSKQLTFTTTNIFKQPLQNRVIVKMSIDAPNCNATFLKNYLEKDSSITFSNKARLLATSDITSQNVKYDTTTGIATIDIQYNQDIDLTKKQIAFVSSQSYSQTTTKYFYDSPSTIVTLQAPHNLLLTTYSSSQEIQNYKVISLAFAGLIGLMWIFWLISVCYNQTATAIEFMIVLQIAYESLLQRRFITDGWIGLVLYGKYCYGYNYNYGSQASTDRLQILSLDTYLFRNLDITTILFVIIIVVLLTIFFYQTIKISGQENNRSQLNATQAKIDMKVQKKEQKNEDEQSQYKIKKGITLILFEAGISLSLLTIKIVVINLMLISIKVIVDVLVVASIMAVCYFLMWYFYYRCFDYEFLKDFSFKRMLRDSESLVRTKSYSSKIGNIFVKYYYLCIFFLLALFGIIDGLPSFGASFFIAIIVCSLFLLVLMVVYGVYFRIMHLVRSACNIFALIGIMVLHMMQSLQVDHPLQSKTGPIICLTLLYISFVLNFGIMGYIEFRRHRTRNVKYRTAKIAALDQVIQINETEEQQLPKESKIPVNFIEQPELNVKKSNKSDASLVQQIKFQSLGSQSREHSAASTHKKIAVPRDQYQSTKQKNEYKQQDIDDILKNVPKFQIVREKVQDLRGEDEHYDQESYVERIQIVDMSQNLSEFTKTKTKIKKEVAAMPEEETAHKREIEFVDIQS